MTLNESLTETITFRATKRRKAVYILCAEDLQQPLRSWIRHALDDYAEQQLRRKLPEVPARQGVESG